MEKEVILVTGTPAVGKSTVAKKLAKQLNAKYVNLTDLSKKEQLALSEDRARDTTIIDETKMRRKLKAIIQETDGAIVIDGHYAAAVTPKVWVTHVFVLRRNPQELRECMRERNYDENKIRENVEAEILDVCLIEALQNQIESKVCEIDTTNKTAEATLEEVLAVLKDKTKCRFGYVDWLGHLEREGKLDEYLKK